MWQNRYFIKKKAESRIMQLASHPDQHIYSSSKRNFYNRVFFNPQFKSVNTQGALDTQGAVGTQGTVDT